jgi:Flp pilus assembly pilin Flp
MNSIINAGRVLAAATRRFNVKRNELGQSTAEYGIVVLVAIALGTAVLMLFTGGVFDDGLSSLLSTVLSTAASMVTSG